MAWQILGILIMVAVGALCGIYYVKVLKKPMIGHLAGGIIIGVIGSVLGGFFLGMLEPVFKWLISNPPLNVNFIATFAGALLLVWVFSRISHQE
ncbi:MAG: hypothetical protein A2Y33_07060 [Spirochaetes bacterium GWF1_51_8]|nr:MAG: hypothetical protein A2Y33_07060 [Spirochaetes bacterium GWF1_51_8]